MQFLVIIYHVISEYIRFKLKPAQIVFSVGSRAGWKWLVKTKVVSKHLVNWPIMHHHMGDLLYLFSLCVCRKRAWLCLQVLIWMESYEMKHPLALQWISFGFPFVFLPPFVFLLFLSSVTTDGQLANEGNWMECGGIIPNFSSIQNGFSFNGVGHTMADVNKDQMKEAMTHSNSQGEMLSSGWYSKPLGKAKGPFLVEECLPFWF